jgi:16S rRNA (uracil1498-N3)-methyltransferase
LAVTRIYQPISLSLQANVQLDAKASHHLVHVLRANEQDGVTLFNGEGGEYQAVITRIDKKGVHVKVIAWVPREVESPLVIHLAQGIARGEKMNFIIQKAVELGVNSITPLLTERCQVRVEGEREEKRLHHWQSIAISACEQSGRNRVPTIRAPSTLLSWLPIAQADRCFVLLPHVSTKLPTDKLAKQASILLLIGPEGGLSQEEVELTSKQGFSPLNLGPRILRTETATLAALTLLQSRYGDFA